MAKATDEDIKGLFDYIDIFNRMNPPSEATVPQMDSVSTTINGDLAVGIPAEKMSVGIAYYGHMWYVPGLTAQADWCKFGHTATKQGKCCGPFAATMGTECGKFTGLRTCTRRSNGWLTQDCFYIKGLFLEGCGWN